MKTKFLLCSVLIIVVMTLTSAASVKLKVREVSLFGSPEKLTEKVIEQAIQLLKEEYIEEVETNKLLNGAVKGMTELLKTKKLPYGFLKPIPSSGNYEKDLRLFKAQFYDTLARYGDKLGETKVIYWALRGLMTSLDDPYSVVLEPKEHQLLTEQLGGGNFGGIGIYIEIEKKTKHLTIVEPIEGTPAYEAGLKAGDWIMKIDGISTKGIDLEVAAKRIRGPKGTKVTLTIKRKDQESQDYAIQRAMIHVKSVVGELKPGNIGYIKIRFFGEDTNEEFEAVLNDLESQGAKALTLDLRNNGGGLITAAIDVCSKFLARGTLVVSVVNYRTGKQETHKSYGSNPRHLPLAVLVNTLSASAAEITAGAMRDTHTGVLMGAKTFGKGSVQTIQTLRDGGALKYTIAHYLTPLGTNINKKGIQPDIEVKMEPSLVGTEKDVQLKKAQEYLSRKIALENK